VRRLRSAWLRPVAGPRQGRRSFRFLVSALLLIGLGAALAACGTSSAGAPSASGGSGQPHPGRSATQRVGQPGAGDGSGAGVAGGGAQGPGNWVLSWSADFGKPGALNKWSYYSGGNGFNLKQLQWYDRSNVSVDKSGQLVISADKTGGGNVCWYGPCRYTSARMETIDSFSQTYGEFEARIKLPPGKGLWPAFWIEGADVYQVGWPACGEIDIMEFNGANPNLVTAYAHSPQPTHKAYLTVPKPITDGFNTYGVTWTPKGITWYFNGYAYSHLAAYKGWPFDHPFFIILNLAVGGADPGSPTATTPFPAKMIVDWVRVYRQA
jgi:beta-glucanase (GH16 family)